MVPLDDFQENEAGHLTFAQRRFLLRWMLIHVGVNGILLGGLSVAILITYPVPGCIMLAATSIYIGMIGYQYWIDLYGRKPEHTSGLIKKLKNRVRGPTHYYWVVDNTQLRVSKAMWERISDGVEVDMYFAPYTRWVLSYRL